MLCAPLDGSRVGERGEREREAARGASAPLRLPRRGYRVGGPDLVWAAPSRRELGRVVQGRQAPTLQPTLYRPAYPIASPV